MSRGPGNIQRYILDVVAYEHGKLLTVEGMRERIIPVRLLADIWAGRHGATPTQHASFRRAAGRLCDQGRLQPWTIELPSYWDEVGEPRSWRRSFAVSATQVQEMTDEMYADTLDAVRRIARRRALGTLDDA